MMVLFLSLPLIFALLVAFSLKRVDSHLFVVLLQSGEILAGLAKLSLFHPFADVPRNN